MDEEAIEKAGLTPLAPYLNLITQIKNLSWMQEAKKQQALKKLRAIRNKIGYPDKWRDYSSYRVVCGNLIGNYISGKGNPHLPAKYRINGVLVNMLEFASAFSCAKENSMVKKEVSEVW